MKTIILPIRIWNPKHIQRTELLPWDGRPESNPFELMTEALRRFLMREFGMSGDVPLYRLWFREKIDKTGDTLKFPVYFQYYGMPIYENVALLGNSACFQKVNNEADIDLAFYEPEYQVKDVCQTKKHGRSEAFAVNFLNSI
jgi:hypothetical protein